jgi:hypothetical protein
MGESVVLRRAPKSWLEFLREVIDSFTDGGRKDLEISLAQGDRSAAFDPAEADDVLDEGCYRSSLRNLEPFHPGDIDDRRWSALSLPEDVGQQACGGDAIELGELGEPLRGNLAFASLVAGQGRRFEPVVGLIGCLAQGPAPRTTGFSQAASKRKGKCLHGPNVGELEVNIPRASSILKHRAQEELNPARAVGSIRVRDTNEGRLPHVLALGHGVYGTRSASYTRPIVCPARNLGCP